MRWQEQRQARPPSLRRWGRFGEAGRREDMGRGTIINMNKGLDARMGDNELMTSGETSWARAQGGGRS